MTETGLEEGQVWACLRRCWHKGVILRSERPIRETNRVLKGRAGIRTNLRSYHLYILNTKQNQDDKGIGDTRFVFYRQSLHTSSKSKARMVLEYLEDNSEKAFFSKEIADTLKQSGVKISDVMSNARRYERQGLVYIRGYRTHDRQTPFKEGYLLTWINANMPREQAIAQAV